jgi:hypothetical protein
MSFSFFESIFFHLLSEVECDIHLATKKMGLGQMIWERSGQMREGLMIYEEKCYYLVASCDQANWKQ